MNAWLALRAGAAAVVASVLGGTLWGIGQGSGTTLLAEGDSGGVGARMRATVVYVVEGDTLRVTVGQQARAATVRILGIDAPEVAHDGEGAECFGAQATADLEALLPAGSAVVVVRDPTQDAVDLYGRLLGYVELRGRDVGLEQIRVGSARARPGFRPVTQSTTYASAERGAEEAGHGLWDDCT